jgi:ubiquinone/menaquinone biosynthesis C-methylase UbiE
LKERKSLPQIWVDLSPDEFVKKWYEEQYSFCTYCNAAGLSQKFMHRSIEKKRPETMHYKNVLEIGANQGEHLQYVNHSFDQYLLTDVNTFDLGQSPLLESKVGLKFQLEDARSMSFEDDAFDRVLCSCVLHHIDNAEAAIMELRRVLKVNGVADLFVSSDPGFLFRLGRYLGPVREAKKLGLDGVKRLVDARDHRNHVAGLTRLIRHVFRNDQIIEQSYPVPFMPWNLSFWKVFHIVKR